MRVLLVSPGFHGYHRAIADSLTDRGHHVSCLVYDDHGGMAGRTWHQVRHQLPHKIGVGAHRSLRREETRRAVGAVAATRPQAVVVVKGDTLEQAFWDSLAGLPRITWLYDEVRRTRWNHATLAGIGPVATYSRLDAAGFSSAGLDSRHLPLAFDHRLAPIATRRRLPTVTFVGARYPSRERVLSGLRDRGIPVRAYGRDWSAHPVDRLRTWRLRVPSVPAERDLSRAEAYGVMAGSAATLNLHGHQDGFTMRTFEAAGVGAVQLIDRLDLDGLYEPGAEVLPWASEDELVDLCRRATDDPAGTERIRVAARVRTLAEHTFDHRAAVLEGAWDTA